MLQDVFEWSDDTGKFWNTSVITVLYNEFGPGEPNLNTGEKCVQVNVNANGTWSAVPCKSNDLDYVCEIGSAPLHSVICDNQPTTLSCPNNNQRLHIYGATYGRASDAVVCPYSFSGTCVCVCVCLCVCLQRLLVWELTATRSRLFLMALTFDLRLSPPPLSLTGTQTLWSCTSARFRYGS